jgi:hypothetical protein
MTSYDFPKPIGKERLLGPESFPNPADFPKPLGSDSFLGPESFPRFSETYESKRQTDGGKK